MEKTNFVSRPESCQHCKFCDIAVHTPQLTVKNVNLCRARPPQMLGAMVGINPKEGPQFVFQFLWPQVALEEWCGLFQQRTVDEPG